MNEENGIVDATFTSVWDFNVAVETKCKVNLKTKEVFDIEKVGVYGVTALTGEKITFNGKSYPVCHQDEATEEDFWYQY